MSEKIKRRNLIKGIVAAGALLAAAPYVGKVSAKTPETKGGLFANRAPTAQTSKDAPLVIVVQDDVVMGFRGEEEYTLADSSLASSLRANITAGA